MFDEKGRLFGVINIIDLMVLVIILVAAGGVYYVRFWPGRAASTRGEPRTIEAVVLVQNVRMATVNVIKVGDKVRESKTNTFLAEVVAIDVKPSEVFVQEPDGRFVESTSTTKKDIYITLRGPGTVSENAIVLNGQEIRIGTRIAIKTNLYAVETTAMGITLK